MNESTETPTPPPTPPASEPAKPPPLAPVAPPPVTRSGAPYLVLLLLSLVAGFVVLAKTPDTKTEKAGDSTGAGGFDWGLGGDGVGLVEIDGVISFPSDKSPFGGKTGASATVQQLKDMRKNDRVKAVVLRVNSPGGTVAASQEIFNQVKRLVEAKKPVVVSMADVAASGGYYVSAPASFIYANPGTLTGSIGVVMQLMKAHDVLAKVGVSFPTFHKGEWKDMGSPYRPFKEGEEKLFSDMVDSAWQQFVGAVYEGRVTSLGSEAEKAAPTGRKKILTDRASVEAIATGQIFSGEKALELGLIDDLGDMEDAVKKAGELCGLEDPRIIKPTSSPLGEIFGSLPLSSKVSVEVPLLPAQLNSPILYFFPHGDWSR